MGKLDTVYHLIDHGLSNQMVFHRGLIQPGGEIYFKKAHQYQNHKGPSNRVSKKNIFLPFRVSSTLKPVEYAGKNRFL